MRSIPEHKKNWLFQLSEIALIWAPYLALSAVPHYGNTTVIIPILPLILSLFSDQLAQKYPKYPIIVQIPLWLFSISMPISLIFLGILDTVLLLTTLIQLTLLVRQKGIKEYLYITLMSFFLLLGAGVQSPEPIVGTAFALYFTAVFIVLPWATTLQADANNLTVSLYTPSLAEGRAFRYRLFSRITILFILLSAWIIIVFSFVFTPRLEAGILGRDVGLITRTGVSTSVSLRGGQTIQVSYTPVMSVHIPNSGEVPPIPSNRLYWRITSLPVYLGVQWRRWPLDRDYEPSPMGNSFLSIFRHIDAQQGKISLPDSFFEKNRGLPRQTVVQEIYLDQIPENGLPVLDRVRTFSPQDTRPRATLGWDSTRDYTVVVSSSNIRKISYTAMSDLIFWDENKLREAETNYSEKLTKNDFEILTQHNLSPEVIRRIEQIVEGKTTNYDKVKAIENWLSGPEFQYTLDIPPLPGDDPVNAFLTQTRRGHCELFASAMALAVRSLGIPARVVSGYFGGEWDAQNQSYIVREGMAHLWVEVLFPPYGWVPFDPTPSSARDIAMGSPLLRSITRWILIGKMFWYQKVVGFDPGFQLPGFNFEAIGFIRDLDEILNPGKELALPSVGVLFLFLFIIAVLFIFKLLFDRLIKFILPTRAKTARITITPDQLFAQKTFNQLEKMFLKYGWNVHSLTAEEIANEIENRFPSIANEIVQYIHDYNRVRFGTHRWNDREKRYWKQQLRLWKKRLRNTT